VNASWARDSAARSRETVIVRIEPGPRRGVPGEGEGRRREGNSRRWALGPSSIACNERERVYPLFYFENTASEQRRTLTIPASSLPSVKVTARR